VASPEGPMRQTLPITPPPLDPAASAVAGGAPSSAGLRPTPRAARGGAPRAGGRDASRRRRR